MRRKEENTAEHKTEYFEDSDWLEIHYEAKKTQRAEHAELMDIRPHESVLDVGCGAGDWFPLLMQKNGFDGRITGVDPNQKALDVASQRFPPDSYPKIKVQNTRFENMAEEYKYDVVHFGNSLGYFTDLEKTIRKGLRMTNTGGRVIVRQYDDAFLQVGPIEEEMFSAVKLGVTKYMAKITSDDFDHFGGRKVAALSEKFNPTTFNTNLLPFVFDGIPSKPQITYLKKQFLWMAEISEPYIDSKYTNDWRIWIEYMLGKHPKPIFVFEMEFLIHIDR